MSSEQFEVFVPKHWGSRTSYNPDTGEMIVTNCEPYEIDAGTAFRLAAQQAAYDFGHSGYTGSIAEKDDYNVLFPNPLSDKDARQEIDNLLSSGGDLLGKWEPALCIEVEENDDGTGAGWWFFGYASS